MADEEKVPMSRFSVPLKEGDRVRVLEDVEGQIPPCPVGWIKGFTWRGVKVQHDKPNDEGYTVMFWEPQDLVHVVRIVE